MEGVTVREKERERERERERDGNKKGGWREGVKGGQRYRVAMVHTSCTRDQ